MNFVLYIFISEHTNSTTPDTSRDSVFEVVSSENVPDGEAT